MTEIDYEKLPLDVESGRLRARLEQELFNGFETMKENGVPLPPASHYASRIAEIIDRGAEVPIPSSLKLEIYQEVLTACQEARKRVLAMSDENYRKGGEEAR